MTVAHKVKGSTKSDSDKIEIKDDDLFLQNVKQIMAENPRLYDKLAKL
jgi:hypothetical protein